MPAGLGSTVQTILGIMGSLSLLHAGALSVRLREGYLVLMSVCSVMSNCVLYLVVVSIDVVFYPKLSCVQWSVNGGQKQIDCGRTSPTT